MRSRFETEAQENSEMAWSAAHANLITEIAQFCVNRKPAGPLLPHTSEVLQEARSLKSLRLDQMLLRIKWQT